jgi:hypothetical protein
MLKSTTDNVVIASYDLRGYVMHTYITVRYIHKVYIQVFVARGLKYYVFYIRYIM